MTPIEHYRAYRHAEGFDAPSRRNILRMLEDQRQRDKTIRHSYGNNAAGRAEFDAIFAEEWAEIDAAIADLKQSLETDA